MADQPQVDLSALLKNLPKIGTGTGVKPIQTNLNHGASDIPADAISWVLDMVDRPRRVVAQTAEAAGEALVDAANNKFDPLKTLGNVASAPVRGLFSTAPSDQETTSQIIENLTDRAGSYDPNYVNKQDNAFDFLGDAGGAARGVAGFAGDVLTDPLTYLGIGAVGQGVKAGVKALRAGEGVGAALKPFGKGVADYSGLTAAKDGVVKVSNLAKGKTAATVEDATAAAADASRGGESAAAADVAPPPVSLAQMIKDNPRTPVLKDRLAWLIHGDESQVQAAKQVVDDASLDTPRMAEVRKHIRMYESQLAEADTKVAEMEAKPAAQRKGIGRLRKERDIARSALDLAKSALEQERKSADVGAALATTPKVDPRIKAVEAAPAEAVLPKERTVGEVGDFSDGIQDPTKAVIEATERGFEFVPPTQRQWMQDLSALARNNPEDDDILEAATLTFKGPDGKTKYLPIAQAAKQGNNPRVVDAVRRAYESFVKQGQTHAALGKDVDAAGRPIADGPDLADLAVADKSPAAAVLEEAPPASVAADEAPVSQEVPVAAEPRPKAGTTDSPMQRFKKAIADEDGKFTLEQDLGAALVRWFNMPKTDATFNARLKEVSDILTGDIDVNALTDAGKMNTPQRAVFSALGFANPGRDIPMVNARYREFLSRDETPVDLASTLGKMDDPQRLAEEQAKNGNAVRKSELRLVHVPKALFAAVKTFMSEDFKIQSDVYKFTSKRGTKRTAEAIGEGLGKKPWDFETFKNYTFVRRIRDEVERLIDIEDRSPGKRFRGTRVRNRDQRIAVMSAAEDGYRLLDQAGVPVKMTWDPQVKNGTEYVASLTPLEAWEILLPHFKQATQGDVVGDALLFGRGSRIPETNLFEAVTRLVHGHPIDEVMETVLNTTKRNGKEGSIPNWLVGSRGYQIDGIGDSARYLSPEDLDAKKPFWATLEPHSKGPGFNYNLDPAAARDIIKVAFQAAADELRERHLMNAKGLEGKALDDAMKMTKATIKALKPLMDDNDLAGQIIAIHYTPRSIAENAAQTARVPSAAGAASRLVDAAFPAGAVEGAERALHTSNVLSDPAKFSDDHIDAIVDDLQARMDEGELDDAQVRETSGLSDEELYQEPDTGDTSARDVARDINNGTLGIRDRLKRWFVQSDGLRTKLDLWPVVHQAGAVHDLLNHKIVSAVNDTFGPAGRGSELVNGETRGMLAWKDMQAGIDTMDPVTAEVRTSMESMLSDVLDLADNNSVIGSSLLHSTSRLDVLNRMFNRYSGLKGVQFDIEMAQREAVINKVSLSKAASKQWQTWDVEDLPQFLTDLNRASTEAATHAGMAASFTKMIGLTNGVKVSDLASRGKRPGFVQVTLADKSKSNLLAFLPKDLYLERTVFEQLKRMDEFSQESKLLSGEFGRFMQETFDPAQQAWKRAITVLRPGHHIRNGIGDASSTFLAEGIRHARKSSLDAFKVMQQKKNYEGVDLLQALEHLGETTLTNEGFVLKSGHFGDLTSGTAWKAFVERGLAPDVQVIEDTTYEANRANKDSSIYRKFLKTASLQGDDPLGRAATKAVGTATEARDHYQRLQHFLQIVYKAQDKGYIDLGIRGKKVPKDLDDLFTLAAERVVRAHPDASLLTNFEYKYLRRLIPFYSWMRGALPFVVANSAAYPGRVTAINKASYNLAVAMGVHPDSLANPFPDDQLFPSFLTDKVAGPQFRTPGGEYFALNPGITSWDVPNQFGQNPIVGVASMLNPAIRVPAELLSGSQWGTQSKIKDTSDYIDQQIPGGAYFDALTGISPTGSVVSLLRGDGLDATYNAATGRTSSGLAEVLGAQNETVDNPQFGSNPAQTGMGLLNYLLGLQVSNASRPDYINLAEIEKRNREADARG